MTSQGSDGHVLAEWFYCDHQSALAEYGLTTLSVLSLGRVSVCCVLHSQPWKKEGHCGLAPRNVSSLV